MSIRPARESDLDAVMAILEPFVLSTVITFDLVPPPRAVWEERLASTHPFLIAEVGGAVVGYAYVSAWKAKPAYARTVEDTIYLAPGFAGMGLGTLLLGALLDATARAGFRQVIAVITDAPETAASIALHRRFGFAEAGRLTGVGDKLGRVLDTVLLQRAVPAG